MLLSFLCIAPPLRSLLLPRFILLLLLTTALFHLSATLAATPPPRDETEKLALLAIKSKIKHDPNGLTHSWNDSFHFCDWTGVTCAANNWRVVSLNLSYGGLSGMLSPFVGNLTFLEGINLEENGFYGRIPAEIGRLSRLKYMNFSNNSFSGEIPGNISGCSALVWLRLGFNQLTGKIPNELGSLQKLERVQLHYNNLTGRIPESLSNLSSVKSLSMSINSLEGSIPESLSRLKNLNFLGLGLNKLSGTVPPSIFNLSSLQVLTLPFNQLHGTLPGNLGLTLPNLLVLNIGNNRFTGPLPYSLSNCSNLLELDITATNFSGKVEIDFSGLQNLWWLVLTSTQLEGDLSFFDSLSKCRKLQVLDLSYNRFSGRIPHSISDLSIVLGQLRLGGNKLSGGIPPDIQNFVNLTELTMEKNGFTGAIPSFIGNLRMLRKLDLSQNSLSGSIPPSLANITNLFKLHLQRNRLTGRIPSEFSNLQFLQDSDLSQNHLSGFIPENVWDISSLTVLLNLSHNEFWGPLPDEVSNLKNLGALDLSENRFSGKIPEGLRRCVSLEYLFWQANLFEGLIPSSLSSLRGLRILDLSRNNLSGEIPKFLQRISYSNLNLSFNNLSGEVPERGVFKNTTVISLSGNDFLCGGPPQLNLSPCRAKNGGSDKPRKFLELKHMLILLLGLLGLVLLFSTLIVRRLRKPNPISGSGSQGSIDHTGSLLKLSFETLSKATDGFSSANLVGLGSFGSVYKGILGNGRVIAVKVLHLDRTGASKSFIAECETLKSIKHRNLVSILTVCSSSDSNGGDFKALVYEFMPNGSLSDWLHPGRQDEVPKVLNLSQRINIAIGVASALEYLHCDCGKPIAHRDLKPSNVLLDREFVAHVGDFGLSRFVPQSCDGPEIPPSSSAGLKGTLGYAAPEYGMGSKASTYGDIYSFGILLLEMLTGKNPTNEMFKDGLDIHIYVKTALQSGSISDVLDPLFVVGVDGEDDEGKNTKPAGDRIQDIVAEVLRIGVQCSAELARNRMGIKNAVRELQSVRNSVLRKG